MGIENMQQHREQMLLQQAQRERDSYHHPSHRPQGEVMVVERGQAENLNKSTVEQNIELRLSSYLAQLKEFRSIERKIEFKAEKLPEFKGFIEASLAQSPAPQNNALMYLLVWAIDTLDLPLAYRISQHGILNKMVMPEGYTRSIAEVIADEVGENCIKNADLAEQHGELLKQFAELIQGEDLADQAHAKLYKAIGIAFENVMPSESLIAYKTALRLNPQSGVKTTISKLEKLLSKSQAIESLDGTPDGSHEHDDENQSVHASTVTSDEG